MYAKKTSKKGTETWYQTLSQKDLQLKFFFEEFEITLLLFFGLSFKCLLIKQAAIVVIITTDWLYNCADQS